MRVPFHKMHGAGNDFVVVDERAGPLGLTASRIAALSDRRTGIGCDQFIALRLAPGADAFMAIHNPDGSEAGACGNATRCVADLLFRETGPPNQAIRTIAGLLPGPGAGRRPGHRRHGPAWRSAGGTSRSHGRRRHAAPAAAGRPGGASMGNPHATFFDTPLDRAAPSLGR